MKTFASILQFQKHFSTDEKCRKYLELQRWGDTPACPFCASTNVCRFETNHRVFKCREKECRKKFSVTVGTIYENTKIPLTKWFLASYILTNHSKGISSHQLASWLDITQKSAWFLNQRIREMLTEKNPRLLAGIVEVDETYVGGKLKNKHRSQIKKVNSKKYNKTPVFGALERGGKRVVTVVLPNIKHSTLIEQVRKNVKGESIMVSDEHPAYAHIGGEYWHSAVNHSAGEYVRGITHTNTIEGFWNILKKQIVGIHHQVSPKHLHRYCNEASWRYNNKKLTQDVKFITSLQNCEGRLKYSQLIKKVK